MDQVQARTPGRSPSNLARGDLLTRVQRLALPAEAAPRVLRFLEQELEAACAQDRQRLFSLDEVRQAGADDALLEALETLSQDRERARAIAAAGLADLSQDELDAVIADARNGRS